MDHFNSNYRLILGFTLMVKLPIMVTYPHTIPPLARLTSSFLSVEHRSSSRNIADNTTISILLTLTVISKLFIILNLKQLFK
jgi:hypothetical protein